MRDVFVRALDEAAAASDSVFLTGDVGFWALEPVRDAFGDRFLNIGVAEQNMIGVAAGIARAGWRVYAYSIASFASARAVEQMKLDVVGHGLPVCIVGNGGGYAYGHMGPTHHALDDVALMTAVGATCWVPAFDHDVRRAIAQWDGPTYLRLGRDELRAGGTVVVPRHRGTPSLSPLLLGTGGHLIALGPLAGLAVAAFEQEPPQSRPTVWAATRLPLGELPPELLGLAQPDRLLVFEEHKSAGGLGAQVAHSLLLHGSQVRLEHHCARGYPSGRFGSQSHHRRESGLDGDAMRLAWYDRARLPGISAPVPAATGHR